MSMYPVVDLLLFVKVLKDIHTLYFSMLITPVDIKKQKLSSMYVTIERLCIS